MKKTVSYRLADYIMQYADIDREDRDIYEYGIKSGIMMFWNTAAFFLISYIFQMFIPGILFTLLFMMLRVHAGGVHLSSSVKCFIVSSLTFAGTLLLLRDTSLDKIPVLVLGVIAGIVIWALAPVEDKNKPLDELEYRVYRKRTRIISTLYMLAMLILLWKGSMQYAYLVSILLFEVAIILVLGIIKNAIKAF